jgi:uncharacterized protein (DUF849 family)
MLIKVCLNGSRAPGEHSALPLTPGELAREGKRSIDAGAGALHVHPRNADGTMTLAAQENGEAINAIRASCPGIPVGVTTAAWIEPDVQRRLELIQSWQVLPDFASVNFEEEGTPDLCTLLLEKGIGVEAGLGSREDAELLVQIDIADRCLRILIEPVEDDTDTALATVKKIEQILDDADVQLPRLLHGFESTAWPLLDAALKRGYDTRIGLEDTLLLPDGGTARNNAELVAFASQRAQALRRI